MTDPRAVLGRVVVSRAGRDRGRAFLIVGVVDEAHVLLSDGATRRLARPKKKKLMHLRIEPAVAGEIAESLRVGRPCSTRISARGLQRSGMTEKNRRDSLSKQDVIEVEGIVSEAHPNAMFEVKLQNGHKILATISGKLRMNFIRILPGDKVTVELSPYDLTRGRITWRGKN